MPETEIKVLSDKSVFPSADILESMTGSDYLLWKKVVDKVSSEYKDTAGEWKYYIDGKQWLFRMMQKKKTLFWSSVSEKSFRVTFYFTDKAIPLIESSNVSKEVFEAFLVAKKYNAIRPATFLLKDEKAVENVLILTSVKAGMK
jgi:hypothetical protein